MGRNDSTDWRESMTGADLYTLYAEIHPSHCDPWDLIDESERKAWTVLAEELSKKELQ